MAMYFGLQVECGTEDAARAVAEHFDGLPMPLSDGLSLVCSGGAWPDIEKNWWSTASPPGASLGAPGGGNVELRKAARMSDIGHLLYSHLRSAPDFRYAICGVGASEFRYYSEIDEDFATLDFHGLVVCDAIWIRLDRPSIFQPFRPGYVWRPYRGEDRDL